MKKYVVLIDWADDKKTVFLENNFFKDTAIFNCVKVEIKDVPNNLATLPDAKLQEKLWLLENCRKEEIANGASVVSVGGV